ncbi:MAG: hypothetical protein PHW01_03725 [Patescibacteria group bacterium]|nr:hypothetical protein [Patescibacteria group bacterium]
MKEQNVFLLEINQPKTTVQKFLKDHYGGRQSLLGWVQPKIREEWDLSIGSEEKKQIKVKLIEFPGEVSFEEILQELQHQNLNQPTIEQSFDCTIRLAQSYPEEVEEKAIVFPHKPWKSKTKSQFVTSEGLLVLCNLAGGPSLALQWHDKWPSKYRYAGILPPN